MFAIGTIVNVAVIVGGTLAGIIIKKGLPEKIKVNLEAAIGVSVVLIGISGTLAAMLRTTSSGGLERVDIMMLILSLIIGSVLGTAMKLNDGLDALGQKISKRFAAENDNRFAQGFINASILFCVGAMAVVGALEDGLAGDPTILYAKSTLDGVISVIMASTLGIGVAFSAIPVFLYQGGITLLAIFIKPYVTDLVLNQMSMVGSALIMCIGLNQLKLTKIKVADFLPATFIPFIWAIITKYI